MSYKCSVCGASFDNDAELRKHVENKHPKSTEPYVEIQKIRLSEDAE